jgi:hypothetical protein
MFVSLAPFNRYGRILRAAAFAASLIPFAAGPLAQAQGTHLWTQSRIEEFEKGTPQGVAITSDGRLLQGPDVAEVVTTPSTFVWSVAVDAHGNAFLGTGSPATVLRVGKDGKIFTLFESKDISVQTIRLQGEDLYAATLPSGKVYKLRADATTKQDESTAAVVFDEATVDQEKTAEGKTLEKSPDSKPLDQKDSAAKSDGKPNYIWDMIFDAKGRLSWSDLSRVSRKCADRQACLIFQIR